MFNNTKQLILEKEITIKEKELKIAENFKKIHIQENSLNEYINTSINLALNVEDWNIKSKLKNINNIKDENLTLNNDIDNLKKEIDLLITPIKNNGVTNRDFYKKYFSDKYKNNNYLKNKFIHLDENFWDENTFNCYGLSEILTLLHTLKVIQKNYSKGNITCPKQLIRFNIFHKFGVGIKSDKTIYNSMNILKNNLFCEYQRTPKQEKYKGKNNKDWEWSLTWNKEKLTQDLLKKFIKTLKSKFKKLYKKEYGVAPKLIKKIKKLFAILYEFFKNLKLLDRLNFKNYYCLPIWELKKILIKEAPKNFKKIKQKNTDDNGEILEDLVDLDW